MKHTPKKQHPVLRRLLVGALLIGIGLGIYIVRENWRPVFLEKDVPPHTVWVTDDGFLPHVIMVKQGEAVIFINKRKTKRMWPASNPHPLHSIYAAFDPKKPLAPGEEWKFIFDALGTWRYHDHLFPSFTGKIVVVDPVTGIAPALDCTKKEGQGLREKEQCWDNLLVDAYESKGVGGAFDAFVQLYADDAEFVSTGCHKHAHGIGDIFYAEYKRKKGNLDSLDFPEETIYCGYGFYHGLFEHMFRDSPDPKLAVEVCNRLDKRLSNNIPRFRLNCFHGIGHGFVQEPDRPVWGNAQAMVEPGLRVCEAISPNMSEVRECMQGTFNVISDWIWRKQYKLAPEEHTPMRLCEEQATRERSLACYYEFSMHLESIAGPDLWEISRRYINGIKDDVVAGMVINSVAAALMQKAIVLEDHTKYIRDCYRLDARLHRDCIIGVSGGFVAHGEPGREYVKALAFCGSNLLTDVDRDACYQNILRTFRGAYTREKVEDICKTIDSAYRKYCDYSKYNQL